MNQEIKAPVTILEGPNGIGKDALIATILKYCPYYKVHYASSDIVKAARSEEDLPLISYTTFETIYSSIAKDPSDYPHIQYRSSLTNLVYNPIFRPEIDLEAQDLYYSSKFIDNKYDENFTIWVCLYEPAYLIQKSIEGRIGNRVKNRQKEIDNIIKVNDSYRKIADKLLIDKNRKFRFIVTEGKGMLDPIYQLDSIVEQIVKQDLQKCRVAYVVDVDLICRDEAKAYYIREMYNTYDWTNFVFVCCNFTQRAIAGRFATDNGFAISRFSFIESPYYLFNQDFMNIYAYKKMEEMLGSDGAVRTVFNLHDDYFARVRKVEK